MQSKLKPAPHIVDYDVELDSHIQLKTVSDKIAYAFVRFLRFFANEFFAKRYGHRTIVLKPSPLYRAWWAVYCNI